MRQTLDETLQQLHQQLADTQDLDAQQLEMLRAAAAEIQETLDEKEVSSASLAQRMVEATQHFSGSHPVLANTIGRVADLLSQMGI